MRRVTENIMSYACNEMTQRRHREDGHTQEGVASGAALRERRRGRRCSPCSLLILGRVRDAMYIHPSVFSKRNNGRKLGEVGGGMGWMPNSSEYTMIHNVAFRTI